jgi:hypothetical protein
LPVSVGPVAQTFRRDRSRLRLDVATATAGMVRRGAAAAGACRAGPQDPVEPGSGHPSLGQRRRQLQRPRQARNQVSHRRLDRGTAPGRGCVGREHQTTPRCSPNCCASPWSSASRSRASPPLSRSCGAAAAGARDSGYDSADNRLLVNSESLVRRSLLGHGVKSTFWREPPENSQPQKHQSPHGGGQWLNRIA